MYHIRLEDYAPKPMPATTDRIVAAHYYGAWKKGSAGLHDGFDDLHDYPERTPLMGYYDEENPAVCDFEIKWALEHGINCFIYCWYRKMENMGKPVAVSGLRLPHALHEGFLNAKYNEMMQFAIMFENSPRWGTTDEKDMLENLMPFWMENYFSRKNYLKIDNKPVLFVFAGERLEQAFGTKAVQKSTFDACRKYAKKRGFDGMIFALCNLEESEEAARNAIDRGYDFRFGYNSGYYPKEHYPSQESLFQGQCEKFQRMLDLDEQRFIPTVSCFADSTPRSTQKWIDMGYRSFKYEIRWYSLPDNFRKTIRRMKEMTKALPEGAYAKKIFMIDNWNEWDEGHFVSPSHQFGFRYLQAVREELTERDNLPDYRTPADMGIDNLNASWAIPDFTGVAPKSGPLAMRGGTMEDSKNKQENTVSAEHQAPQDRYVNFFGDGEGFKVLFLGNSITHHRPKEEYGWFGSYGMAASAEEKDYVHLVVKHLKEKYGKVQVCIGQLANLEREYENSEETLPELYSEARDFQADLVIFRGGENTSSEKAKAIPFYPHLLRMGSFFVTNPKAKVIVTDMFWNGFANPLYREWAEEMGYAFVHLTDLETKEENKAIGLFPHRGVSIHPGDLGMARIAERIIKKI